jgi:hypothetical protein
MENGKLKIISFSGIKKDTQEKIELSKLPKKTLDVGR